MRRLLFICLLIPALAWADGPDDTLFTNGTTSTSGNYTWGRMGKNVAVDSYNRFHVLGSNGTSTSSDSTRYLTSDDNGKVWTDRGYAFSTLTTTSSYPWIGMFSDSTAYLQNDNGFNPVGGMGTGTSILFKDTIETDFVNNTSMSALGRAANGKYICVIDSGADIQAIPYYFNGTTWSNANNWTKGNRRTFTGGTFNAKYFPVGNGVGGLITIDGASDSLLHTDSLSFVYTDSMNWVISYGISFESEGNGTMQNVSVAAKGYASDTFCVAWERADTVYASYYYLNPSTHLVSRVGSISIIEVANAAGDTDSLRHCPSVGWMGDTAYVFYKYYDGANWDIRFRRGVAGGSFVAAATYRDGDGTYGIFDLQCPAVFDNTGDTLTVEVFWVSASATGATADGLYGFCHVDTVATAVTCTPPTSSLDWIESDTSNAARVMLANTYGTTAFDTICYYYDTDSTLADATRWDCLPDSGTTHTIIIDGQANNIDVQVWAIGWGHEGATSCADTSAFCYTKTKYIAPDTRLTPVYK